MNGTFHAQECLEKSLSFNAWNKLWIKIISIQYVTHQGRVLEQLNDTETPFLRTILSSFGYLSTMAKSALLPSGKIAIRSHK